MPKKTSFDLIHEGLEEIRQKAKRKKGKEAPEEKVPPPKDKPKGKRKPPAKKKGKR